ncbi:MAG: (Fe-S)-binding protein [Thermodesulfobacteriota bacterium]
MPSANLYLDKVDFLRYLNRSDCTQCGIDSCKMFIEMMKKGIKNPKECPVLDHKMARLFEVVLKIEKELPEIPLLTHPRPSSVGLVELNMPHADSLVIISGNNEYTEQVVMTVLGMTQSPFFVIFVNTEGNTLDMSVIYSTFTAERIYKALKETGIEEKVSRKELLLPGLAYHLKEEVEKLTGWRARVGPVCVAELPLFLSEEWI